MWGWLFVVLAIYAALYLTFALLPGYRSMAVALIIGLPLGLWLYHQLTYNPDATAGSLDLTPMANLMAAVTICGVFAWAARMAVPRQRPMLRWAIVVALFFGPALLRMASLI
jgi:hypothetical protein